MSSKTHIMTTHFEEIIKLIEQSKRNALKAVNIELIDLYWNIGSYISNKIKNSEWGESIVMELANYIQLKEPNIKGFSDKNLWRMKQFFETYCEYPKLSPAMREINPDISNTFKDSYVFNFLNLKEKFKECDLQKGLVNQMKEFILELGKDFIFIEEEYKLQVGNHDFYIDLLFYNRALQCLVAIELKADKFKPEHIGQLNFYLEVLDKNVKRSNENPSIGVLLCKDKDSEVVEYSLNRTLSPTLVSEYQMQLPDKKILQNKLHELFDSGDCCPLTEE